MVGQRCGHASAILASTLGANMVDHFLDVYKQRLLAKLEAGWIRHGDSFGRGKPQLAVRVARASGLLSAGALHAREAVAQIQELTQRKRSLSVSHSGEILAMSAHDASIGCHPEKPLAIL